MTNVAAVFDVATESDTLNSATAKMRDVKSAREGCRIICKLPPCRPSYRDGIR